MPELIEVVSPQSVVEVVAGTAGVTVEMTTASVIEVHNTPVTVTVAGSAPQVIEVFGGPRGPQGEPGAGTADLIAHIVDLTPHPAYDDLPSLRLLFENGLT